MVSGGVVTPSGLEELYLQSERTEKTTSFLQKQVNELKRLMSLCLERLK